jgi:RND family efflux transporter MFP subunit
MKTRIVVTLIAGLLVVAGLIAVRLRRVHQKETAPLAPVVAPAVKTARVVAERVVQTRHALGIILGADEAAVAPQVMARIVEINVREGNLARPGQVLAVLDNREFQDAVAEAEAMQAAAQIAWQAQHDAIARDQRLFEVKGIAQEQWDRSRATEAAARAQLQVAERRLDQSRARLAYCQITSPVDGVVARRLADPGDLAVPGKPMFKLVRQQSVRVRAELPPEDLPALRAGLPVTLTGAGGTLTSTVTRVFPAMGDSHLATLEVDVAEPPAGFVSGATVGVDVEIGASEGLSVPSEALLEGETGAWVFVVDARQTVHPVGVRVLTRSADKIAVEASALQIGAAVIVARSSRFMTFAEGMKVAAPDNNERSAP